MPETERKIVSEELREYLGRHDVYSRLQEAMEAVLLTRPGRPVEFLKAHFARMCKGTGKGGVVRRVLVLGPEPLASPLAEALAAELGGLEVVRPDPSLGPSQVTGYVIECLERREMEGWVLVGFPQTELQAGALKTAVDCLPTHALELVVGREDAERRARQDPGFLAAWEAAAAARSGWREAFGSYLCRLGADGLDLPALLEKARRVVAAPQAVQTREHEVLPRGPAIVDAETEVADYTMGCVPNTVPLIE